MALMEPPTESQVEALLSVFLDKEEAYAQVLEAQRKQQARFARDIGARSEESSKSFSIPEPFQINYLPPKISRVLLYQETQPATERLVPIRIDCEIEGIKLRDTFTWNVAEKQITPELFADILCDDLSIPQEHFRPHIVKAIKEQITDYENHAPPAMMPVDPAGRGNDGKDTSNVDAQELRTIIKLDITIGNYCLMDQFEWDLNCKRNSPERFAELMVNELQLGPEFQTAIAHSIREQIQVFAKSLLLVDHRFDGKPVHDEDLASCFLPPITHARRYDINAYNAFGPQLMLLRDTDAEKRDRDDDREVRRKRRQTHRSRRNTVILPDRDIQRTNRTALPPSQTNPALMIPTITANPSAIRKDSGLYFTSMVQQAPNPALVSPPARGRRGAKQEQMQPTIVSSVAGLDPSQVGTYRCHKCTGPALVALPLPEGTKQSDILCDNCRYLMATRPPAGVASRAHRDGRQRTESPHPQRQSSQPPYRSSTPTPHPQQPLELNVATPSSVASVAENVIPSIPQQPEYPGWLLSAEEDLNARFPSDMFELTYKNGAFKVRCLECRPRKLYETGSGETLENFEQMSWKTKWVDELEEITSLGHIGLKMHRWQAIIAHSSSL
ncbi:hypothetical protein SmJEL517_g05412 [Synchytrium microbalum]|uniref:Uncharacterized protein n=1 Tax=Synchytrium microbalum TaxID=1806994 RepID=A0A507BUD8_9FUNG|nr:uncharacterized protein SmJEL517_g05412 [Synchytrium microbalum]TPX31172.1 hypothetical protein SmJEL517_g05412 [Synchytrium microbalum]